MLFTLAEPSPFPYEEHDLHCSQSVSSFTGAVSLTELFGLSDFSLNVAIFFFLNVVLEPKEIDSFLIRIAAIKVVTLM